ncbi:Uncharacterised protein [Campylobacter jejuni subsp. doylei]|uniref:Phage-Barnase-EndoU-ColicinE5/D-RelE-like nuclease domain-containing protein n=1 Tax=Campylobacter jejuni subsp. doylei TaxID=32021 RepID=A0A3S4SAQ8_CAMJU|nr:Uncharacterised protein [Campylobacter jejuni subsp. doylei]
MNEQERWVNETHAMNALLEKHRIEGIGYDFKSLAKDMKDVEFSSKKLKDVKGVIDTYALIYNNNRDLIMTALTSSGKKTNSSIATTLKGALDRILISGILARLHALVPFMKSAKEQALRNQILDAIKLAKTNKEILSNLKNIKIADGEQSRIFKDALNHYMKVDKEQNKRLKDALIKEGVIKGDNFFMDKVDSSKAKSDYTAKFNVEKWINNVSGILKDEWVVNLKAMAKKHPEMFKNEADVFKVIKEIKDNPTHFFKNYDDEVALIAKPLKDDKVGNIAIKKDSGKIIHINKTKGKDLERLNRRNKAMLTGTPTPATTKGSTTNVEGDLLQHSFKDSTQAKPKTNLIEELKENIKAKEVEKKNKKSVKQRLDEKIQDDKKASEDILKRYDNFLKESKNNKLDFLDRMSLNTIEYKLSRQIIVNAKESTNKGIKKDIPSALRGKIEKELNINPLKEFGKNYTEYYYDGKGALQKLLIEKQGQVAGAFHRKDLGDIDLVWGDGNFGLSHIINRREEDFIKQGLNKIEAKNKALNFIKEIENIINNGNVKKGNNRAFIDIKNSRVMVALDYKGKDKKWIITAYNFY